MARKRRVMAAKNVGSAAKHHYKQTKSVQNNKRDTLLYFLLQLCASTGTYRGLPLVCYMKIFALKMLSMKIFFKILFVWQENDLVLALNSKK